MNLIFGFMPNSQSKGWFGVMMVWAVLVVYKEVGMNKD